MALNSEVARMNKNLLAMDSDFLYHLGINIANTKDTSDIIEQFGDVKFVCMGGTEARMEVLAKQIRTLLKPEQRNERLVNLCEKAQRYAVFKVGPVLCCSHGIGVSSMSVLLHELIKLVRYAKCQDPIFIRLGTCGGLGVPAGTVVLTENAYNGYLRNEQEIAILGKKVARTAKLDMGVLEALLNCGSKNDKFKTILANTLTAECFYEGQGRLDGAACHYTLSDKINFLRKCHDEYGIRNIEMESTMFAALTLHVGIKAAVVCVTFIDRLIVDQVTISVEEKDEFEQRPLTIVGRYIQNALKTL